jgi:hypothetical protein
MKDRAWSFRAIYSAVCAILLAAFVGLGGRAIWIGPSEAAFVHPTPFASTDAYFEAFFDLPNGSRRCLEVMRRVSGKGALVLFCARGDTRGALGFDLVSYLSWPEQIRRVEVERVGLAEAVRDIDRRSVAAAIFCNVEPPPEFRQGWRIGPRLFVAPSDQLQ